MTDLATATSATAATTASTASTATTPLLAARGLTVRFGGLLAVDQVDLSFGRAELVGIIGPNGAGKTTLFNSLSGVQRPTAGRIEVAGQDLTGRAPHHFARSGVARTFQTPRVFADMSVARNVAFGFEFAGRLRSRGRDASAADRLGDIAELLAFAGLDPNDAQLAGELTPARQRALEIAMALATRPDVLLLDEVAAGLTEAEVARTSALLRRIRDDYAITVIWVEHAVAALLATVERAIVLDRGRLLFDGPASAVASNAAVVDAYLGTAALADADAPVQP